jgi:hypothetical protein
MTVMVRLLGGGAARAAGDDGRGGQDGQSARVLHGDSSGPRLCRNADSDFSERAITAMRPSKMLLMVSLSLAGRGPG